MLSSTTMDASTRMPKSMAPMEMRLADCPVSTISEKAKSTANGMVAAAMKPDHDGYNELIGETPR